MEPIDVKLARWALSEKERICLDNEGLTEEFIKGSWNILTRMIDIIVEHQIGEIEAQDRMLDAWHKEIKERLQ